MSILDKASFVLAPGGYSEGYVYGLDSPIAPKKLAYSRSATSTRVNPKGLIESVPYNRILNSENLLNLSTWVTGGGFITKTAGFLDPFGGNNACKIDLGAGNTYIVQNTNQKLGTVTISGYFRADSDIVLGFNDGAANPNQINVTTTWKRFQFTFTTGASFDTALQIDNYYGVSPSAQAKSFYVFGLQLVQGTEVKDYLPTTDRLNVPTLDYSTGKPTYLFEPSITNLLTYSEDFSNVIWTKQGTNISTNQTVAPDGNSTADTISTSTNDEMHRFYQGPFSYSTLTTFSFSVYLKYKDHRYISFGVTDNLNYRSQVVVDLVSGVITENYFQSGTLTSNLQAVGNGWYRLTGTFIPSALYAGNNVYLLGILLNQGTWNMGGYSGTGTGAYFWGAQLQENASATSYIPTTNASVTRLGGSTGTFGASYFGTNKGTVLIGIEGIRSLVTLSSAATVGLYTGGTLVMTLYDDGNGIGFYDYYGNSFLCLVNRNAKRMLIKWDGTTSVGFVNGVKTATLTTGSTRNIDNMGGLRATINAYNLSVFAIFPEALSDAECIALTS